MSCERGYRSDHDLAVDLLDWLESSASEKTLGDVQTVFRSLEVLQMNKRSIVKKLLGDIEPGPHTLAECMICMIRGLQSTDEWALEENERLSEQMEQSTLSNFPNSQYLDKMLSLVKKLNDPGPDSNHQHSLAESMTGDLQSRKDLASNEKEPVNRQKYLCLVLRDFCLWIRPTKYWDEFLTKLEESLACWGGLVSLGTEARDLCDYNIPLPARPVEALNVLFKTVEKLCQNSADFKYYFRLAKLRVGPSLIADEPWWHLNYLIRSVKDACEFKM
jgi:hypothetical protein